MMSSSFRESGAFRTLQIVVIGLALLAFAVPFLAGVLSALFPDTIGAYVFNFMGWMPQAQR